MTNLSKEREKTLHVSLGSQCNNNCIFCMEPRFSKWVFQRTLDEHKQFIKNSSSEGFTRIVFTHKEPTLSEKKLIQLIKYANKIGYKDIMLITNGRLLSYNNFTLKLFEAGLNHVEISLHGSNQKIHESLTRTPGSFIQTIMGITNVCNYSKKFDINYSINFTITSINFEDIYNFYELAHSFNPNNIIFNFYCTKCPAERDHYFLLASYSRVIKQLQKIFSDNFSLIDFPFCIVPENLLGNIGHIEDYHLFDEFDRRGYARNDWIYSKETTEACEGCKYVFACPKPSKEYIKKYGISEFVKQ